MPQKVSAYYTKGLHVPDGTIEVPPLVWRWNASHMELQVYAFKNTEAYEKIKKVRTPDEDTDLFYAPFHNVYENGRVCLGSGWHSNIKEARTFKGIMEQMEHVFWNTRFSEIHHNGCNGNLNTLHHKLVTTQCPFPTDMLKSFNHKLKDLL